MNSEGCHTGPALLTLPGHISLGEDANFLRHNVDSGNVGGVVDRIRVIWLVMERLAEYTLTHLCFINLTKAYDSVDQLPWWEIYLYLVAVNILSLVAMSFLSGGASVLKNAILQWHCIGLQPLLKINNGTLNKALAWPLHCPMMGATVGLLRTYSSHLSSHGMLWGNLDAWMAPYELGGIE